MKNRVLLIVLDGFGIGKDSPCNAIQNAHMPFFKNLWQRFPHTQLWTHGEAVGLPDGIMGNSEVGHMTMGAGRVIFQDLVRINRAIRSGEFFKNSVLLDCFKAGAAKTGRVHLVGLFSDGGVHSHIDHLFALLELGKKLKVPEVFIHAVLDGRDTPPTSSLNYIKRLFNQPAFQSTSETKIHLASLSGRYFTMDRDKRWERTELAYKMLTGRGACANLVPTEKTLCELIEKSHKAGKTDEFLEPLLIHQDYKLENGDSLFFFNFRADRARQLTKWLMVDGDIKLSGFATMTEYDEKFTYPVAFRPQNVDQIFPQQLEKLKATQLRVAESEKAAHVTFFFNCGREKPYDREDRILIPSPRDVATYDLKPQMSALEVAAKTEAALAQKKYDFVLVNFANADMVGHTGNYEATVQAMQCLDQCLAKVLGAATKAGYHTFLTADHGNAEQMCDHEGKPHTQHTLNPVPLIYIAGETDFAKTSSAKNLKEGTLADLIPTLMYTMGLQQPDVMSGKNLLL